MPERGGRLYRKHHKGGPTVAPWTPPSLPALKHWPKASTIPGLSDGNNITTWPDDSGNAWDFTGAADKPVYKTNIVNSLAVARFDGSGLNRQQVTRANTGGLSDLTTFTFGMVIAGTNVNDTLYVMNATVSPDTGWVLADAGSNQMKFRPNYQTPGFVFNANHSSGFHIVIIRTESTGRTVKIWFDGGTAVTDSTYSAGTFTANTTGTFRIGCGASFSEGITGDIAEWVMDGTALAAADVNSLGGYFATTYALTWTNVSF